MFGAYLVSRVMCECVDCGVYAHGVEIGECHHESVCVIASRFTCGFPRAGYPVRKAVVVIIRYHGSRSCCVHPQVRISHLQTGHGGVWRLPCSPRLLAGCSLSSATLSWSDDDVYR